MSRHGAPRASRAAPRIARLLALSTLHGACAQFRLAQQEARLAVERRPRATAGMCAVLPFAYEPSDPDESGRVSEADLARWQTLFVDALERTEVFGGGVAAVEAGGPGVRADYVLSGRITRFSFQKNWVPTFFPLHVGMSFFTFYLYSLLGGPTTVTLVELSMEFELRRASSEGPLVEFRETFQDTSTLNVYSESSRKNPYENPGIALSKIVDGVAGRVALALQ